MTLLLFFLMCVGINHLTDVLVNVDLLEPLRKLFVRLFPKLGKLALCKYCQSFWLTSIGSFLFASLDGFQGWQTIGIWLILWFSGHRLIQIIDEWFDRFIGRIVLPKSLNANVYMTLDNGERATISENRIRSAQQSESNEKIISSSERDG